MRTSLITAAFLFTSCEDKSNHSSRPTDTEWLNPHDIRPGPIRHDSLPPAVIEQIKNIQRIFAEVDKTPVEKWIEEFQRDINYERELQVWQAMSVSFEAFNSTQNQSLAKKREAYALLLMRSSSSSDEVIKKYKLKALTQDEALRLLESYKLEAKPIRVIEQ